MTTQEQISKINKVYGWNYQVANNGRVFQMFMGKKMFTTIEKLNARIENMNLTRIINENSRMVIAYLKENGYESRGANADGSSVYFHRSDVGIVRVSNHKNTCEYYTEPTFNAFSDVKGGYVELIEKIETL